MILQKSRFSWLKEGDSNSGFFHKVMKQIRRRNHIGLVFYSVGMVDSVEEVREAVFNHSGNKFIETEEVRPLLEGILFKFISREDAVGI